MSPRMDMAQECWGVLPDWVEALVNACDADGSSQNKVARRLKFSATVISQVLRNEYKGSLGNIERRVRAIYAPGTVQCPALGPISSEDCLTWQDDAGELRSSAPMTVRMFRACRKCPRYNGEPDT
ncbi:hypothetical protein BOO69_09535 [Sulfitobacter alexandrii]|uniref:Transcriptional regulator n=1 Tax=Sulfitobacter alexandrii TaxID=1917485 RepID=A0A1J0WH21_9RHOB|nr:hypothetical protein [Sulfitobacter alexandrii]APE43628.1 hypothetical protein BOO69_09535 [Sulfitobacter alexandrii]